MDVDAATGPRFLIAGDSSDLPQIRGMLARLPVDAFGQIYVEIAAPIQIQPWTPPPGMTVTWLRRDRASHQAGESVPRGELLRRAVSAWAAEWLPDSGSDRPSVLWIGCASSPRVDDLYRELSERLGPDTLHHPHR